MMSINDPPLVSIELHFNGEYPDESLRYGAHDLVHEHAPEGATGQGESVDTAPFSYQYTGRHDHGLLPDVAQPQGHYSALLTACQRGKQDTERILKPIVDEERAAQQQGQHQAAEEEEEEEAKSSDTSSENSLDREIDNMDSEQQEEEATITTTGRREKPDTMAAVEDEKNCKVCM
jgi:hypothetical protein